MMLGSRLLGAIAAGAIVLGACGDGGQDAATDTAATTPAGAATSNAAADGDQAETNRQAQEFVNAAAQANLAEIQTSQMALERGSNADVKAFAQMIIDDHNRAGEQLNAAVASATGLTPPPTTLDERHMRRVNDLDEVDGDEDFDNDYIEAQVDMHNDAIDLFQDYINNGQTPAIRAFAEQTLPVLQAHKVKAEQLRAALGE